MTIKNSDLVQAIDQVLDERSLTWAARWIEDSLKGETNARVIEFGKNMAITLRAAKLPDTRADSAGAMVDGISWAALLTALDGWNAAIQCLINDINARAAAPLAPKEEEAHRCPHCGRRMIGDFDEDVGFWYECANCDYREAVSSTVTAAKPSGATREAAEAIVKAWLWHTPEYDQERARQDIEQIISRHFPTAVESRCVHNVPVGYGCHYCPDTIATTPPAPLVSDCDPDG